jgi:hypothetical protein
MKNDRVLILLLVCIFAFAGGGAAQFLLGTGTGRAAGGEEERQVFRDRDGRGRLDVGVYNGQPVEDLYGEDGKLRVQIGTYTGDYSSDEKGLPVMTFTGNNGHLKMLLRLAGPNQSPVLVMKDNQERDRVVLGLSLAESGEEPFLAIFDRYGAKHMVFGNY